MEKKLYEVPEMAVVPFEEDILLASGDDQGEVYIPGQSPSDGTALC